MTEASRIDRLLDAIELIKANRRDEARVLLRDLIREDSDFEDAWLWMSLAVDTLDQASVCLDNVLRINPNNYEAAGALYRIRVPEMEMHKRRSRLRMYRDMAIGVMWLIIAVTFVGVYLTYAPMIDDLDVTPTSAPRTMIAVTATISSPDR
jgi:hypothetical protein